MCSMHIRNLHSNATTFFTDGVMSEKFFSKKCKTFKNFSEIVMPGKLHP